MEKPANVNVKQIALRAVVTRADGTVEDLGIIDFYSKNPFKMWAWKFKKFISKWSKK